MNCSNMDLLSAKGGQRRMEMDMNQYMPVRLMTGEGCVARAKGELARLGERCLILTGKRGAKQCGALDDVISVLEELKIAWKHMDIVGQNPKFSDCLMAAEEASSFGAQFIIGIGGGSPMDAAKCTAVLAANAGMTQKEFYAYSWPKQPLATVVVGTTAGTGSEVTKVAVITTLEGNKKSVKEDSIYPKLAMGDYTYTGTLSEEFTRSTAIDALAHCMESYFCRTANELSRTHAVRGIRILLEVFRKMEKSGFESLNLQDREALYNASIYGGLAINVTGTTMPHTAGYLLTERYGLAHGTACAVFLPQFYLLNKRELPGLTEQFLAEIGCGETEYLHILEATMPEYHVEMGAEDIVREHGRWIGNASLANGAAVMSPEQMDEMLEQMFVV